MTPWILAALALFYVQSLLPNSLRYLQDRSRLRENLGIALTGRDNPPQNTLVGARAGRALTNIQEALWVFIPLALLLQMAGQVPELAHWGAGIFLAFRVLYVPAYLSAVAGLRSAMWMGSWVGLAMLIVAVVQGL